MDQISENVRGALLMMGSMVAFTLNDAFMKGLSGDIPLFQAIFLRGIGTVAFLSALAYFTGQMQWAFGRRNWLMIAVRTGAEVGGTFFFLSALFLMPIANVTAVLQALPLTVALGAALFLNEPLGWRRLSAVIVGLVGVLLIVRPGTDGFSIYSLYALGAVICVTVRDLAVRRIDCDVPSIMIGLVAAAAVLATGAIVTAGQDWVSVDGPTIWKLLGAMICIIFGYVFSVTAMRHGEVSFVAPFRYTSLVAALIVGWFAFGDWPAPLTFLGAAIVVGMGLFTLYRERQLAAQTRLSNSQG